MVVLIGIDCATQPRKVGLPQALVLAWAGLVSTQVAASPSSAGSQDRQGQLPAQVQPLARELQAHGFQIRLAPPPKRGAYGLFESKSKTLWIAPVTIPLGIARQTFLHEAAHAIQSCPSGQLTPLGVSGPLNPVVERKISAILLRNYHHTYLWEHRAMPHMRRISCHLVGE